MEISVSFVDNAEIRRLNREFRQNDTETDVLSFPLYEGDALNSISENAGPPALGDIVISVEKAYEQANEYAHGLRREIGFLTVHSMLHLLGRHHEEGEAVSRIVRGKEESVLQSLGLSRKE